MDAKAFGPYDSLRQNDPIVRTYTAAEWTAGNYVLLRGELGIETDTGKQKAGVGKAWADTSYFTPAGYSGTFTALDAGNNTGTLTFVNGVLTGYTATS